MADITVVDALPLHQGADKARHIFSSSFGYEPRGVWYAPGRVNLIGEHTDYNGGLCMPIALPHATFAAIGIRDGSEGSENLTARHVRLVSAQLEGVTVIDLDRVGRYDSENRVDNWGAYVVGVMWALEQQGFDIGGGYDIAIDSCVPFGAGLSSSAALECAVAVGIDELAGLGLAGSAQSPDRTGRLSLVTACISAENDIAGANTGGLDQSASLLCSAGYAMKLDCRDHSTEQLPFDMEAAGLALLVIDTKAPHSLNDGQYASRRSTCEQAAQILGVSCLAGIDNLHWALDQLEDDVMKRRVRHVCTEIDRTRQACDVMASHDLSEPQVRRLGELWNASHDSLRDDYEVTCPELDVAVDVARSCGAYGARMTGGGFGGSAIALVKKEQALDIARSIAKGYETHQFNPPEFLIVTPSAPAGKVN